MPPGPSPLELAAALLQRLRTAPDLTVLDGQVRTTPTGAYVVLYDAAPRLTAGRLVGTADRSAWNPQLVCVGRDPDETRHVVGTVLGLVANWRPFPSSRGTSWLTPRPDGAPILRDDSVPGDIRFSQTLTFGLTTTRS